MRDKFKNKLHFYVEFGRYFPWNHILNKLLIQKNCKQEAISRDKLLSLDHEQTPTDIIETTLQTNYFKTFDTYTYILVLNTEFCE